VKKSGQAAAQFNKQKPQEMSQTKPFDLEQELESLLAQDPETAHMSLMYDLTDRLEGSDQAFTFAPGVLLFIERHPEVDFGGPGPLVHYLEKFYRNGYEELLVDSFRRRPTPHTAYMLNRLINGSSGEVKAEYLALLRAAEDRTDIDESSLEAIANFIKLHTE
jgi:hypothetical protein